jgi:hypothetical protein
MEMEAMSARYAAVDRRRNLVAAAVMADNTLLTCNLLVAYHPRHG